MALLALGWLVPALAWFFEIPCAFTHLGKAEGAGGRPRGWEGQGDSAPHREVENGLEQQCSKVGCCRLPSIIPAPHQKAEMKASSHSPHHNNVDPPPEITAPLKEVAFA